MTVRKRTVLGGALVVFPVIGAPGNSCYWRTIVLSLVSSGHILYKGPLRVVHLSSRVAQTTGRPQQTSFAPLSFRCMRIESCFHWSGQSFTLPSHNPVVRFRKLPFRRSCLTAIHQDRSRPGQALPPTVSPLQLWSCRVVSVTDYEGTNSSSRWVVLDPPERSQWISSVPCPYPTAFILFVHLGGAVVCATYCYVWGDGWR